MKKALVIVLIVLVVATGLPLIMSGSGMVACHDCGPAALIGACTFGLLSVAVALLLTQLASRLAARRASSRSLQRLFLLERPPRLA